MMEMIELFLITHVGKGWAFLIPWYMFITCMVVWRFKITHDYYVKCGEWHDACDLLHEFTDIRTANIFTGILHVMLGSIAFILTAAFLKMLYTNPPVFFTMAVTFIVLSLFAMLCKRNRNKLLFVEKLSGR